MRRTERLEIIKDLVGKTTIRKQMDLVEYFGARGHEVTQATISRDIKDLGLLRKAIDGGSAYVLPKQVRYGSANLLGRAIQEVSRRGSLLRLDVKPGTAMGVKNTLRMRDNLSIFAMLTDDDTVLIYTKGTDDAKKLERQLRKLV